MRSFYLPSFCQCSWTERSGNKDVQSPGIELRTSCTSCLRSSYGPKIYIFMFYFYSAWCWHCICPDRSQVLSTMGCTDRPWRNTWCVWCWNKGKEDISTVITICKARLVRYDLSCAICRVRFVVWVLTETHNLLETCSCRTFLWFFATEYSPFPSKCFSWINRTFLYSQKLTT